MAFFCTIWDITLGTLMTQTSVFHLEEKVSLFDSIKVSNKQVIQHNILSPFVAFYNMNKKHTALYQRLFKAIFFRKWKGNWSNKTPNTIYYKLVIQQLVYVWHCIFSCFASAPVYLKKKFQVHRKDCYKCNWEAILDELV